MIKKLSPKLLVLPLFAINIGSAGAMKNEDLGEHEKNISTKLNLDLVDEFIKKREHFSNH